MAIEKSNALSAPGAAWNAVGGPGDAGKTPRDAHPRDMRRNSNVTQS
jgi:hypothetical protein